MTTKSLVAPSPITWFFVAAAPIVFANCSSNSPTDSGGNGGSTATGGATGNGGATGTGGSSGGAPGNGGAPANGGAPSGGSASGGAANGGMASGGAASGGSANGGAANGGMASGGASGSSGGGGKSSGGSAGTSSTGGSGGSGGGGSGTFSLTSPDLKDGAKFDAKFTCASMNGQLMTGANPELDWSGAPAGTKSFVITFIDTTIGENSAMGQHWAIWNIPASVMKFPQGTTTLSGDLATAKQSGKFFAPCAQMLKNGMDDEYAFTIYALSTDTLAGNNLSSVASVLSALKAASAQQLGTAKLTGHAGLKGG